MGIHSTGTPRNLGRAMQVHAQPGAGLVLIRSTGDKLTLTGVAKVIAALGTYYNGLAANTPLGGWSSVQGVGGVAPDPTSFVDVSFTGVRALCKVGDENSLATTLEGVLTTAGNATATPALVAVAPGGVESFEQ